MRKNYFAKIVKYIKDVYNVEEGFRNLQDERINPTYKTDKIVLPVLFSNEQWGTRIKICKVSSKEKW